MEKEFVSISNKAMIWQLLSENNAFENINNSHFDRVRNLCEKKFAEISKIDNPSLIEQNKMVISEIMKDIGYLKSQTVVAPLQEVKINMDRAFENKEEEFISLVKRPSQPEIQFNEKNMNDDLPINNEEMESLLDSLRRDRTERSSENNVNSFEQKSDQKPLLKINSTTSNSNSKTGKHVQFSEEMPAPALNKFKKNPPDNQILNLLNTIVQNQNSIMNELKIIKQKI